MPAEVIVFGVLTLVIVLCARKWDTLKWWLALALIGLAVYTAYTMGMFDSYISDVPSVEFK